MIGYRTEDLYGEGYRDAAAVMAHETFEMSNTDILDTLSETLLKNTSYKEKLKKISDVINEETDDEEIEEFLDNSFNDEEIGIKFFNEILNEVKKETGKTIKYVLWLCDSIEDIKKEYECENIHLELKSFDMYEKSDIVFSDLGSAGKLYGYENEPTPL